MLPRSILAPALSTQWRGSRRREFASSPRDVQRVVSQQSNWRESVLYGSQVCIRQRGPFLTPNRGKVELIGWGRARQSFRPGRALTPGWDSIWDHAHAAVHGAVHDTFMTLPPYTRTSEGEVHELGLGVRSCFHSARSDPLSEKRESIERACEATSAEGTARCASRGLL
jgi:hypothetical protein